MVVTNKHVLGKKLHQIRDDIGLKNLEGVYLCVSFKRPGPADAASFWANTPVRRGDVIESGPAAPVKSNEVAAMVGHTEASGGKSDLAYHALAILIGTLVGLLSIEVGGHTGDPRRVGGGVLVSGLCFGWLHTTTVASCFWRHAAGGLQWILSREFGLSAFTAAR